MGFIHNAIGLPVAARIDTGARTSSVWASDIHAGSNEVTFKLFGPGHDDYTDAAITLPIIDYREVRSSMGAIEKRYVVELEVVILGKTIVSDFTLADRSRQRYPILLGRNTLSGNFLVDCSLPGEALHEDDEEEFMEDDNQEGDET